MGGYTHTLPWVEQSSGPRPSVTGATWLDLGAGFVLSVLFPSYNPWASSQTCPCPPVLSQVGRGNPCRYVGGQDLGEGPFRGTSLWGKGGAAAQVWNGRG